MTGEESGKPKLRGSLAPQESKLRGSLAGRGEVSAFEPKEEGATVSPDRLPTIEALATLVGKTLVQRDGGGHYRVEGVSKDERRGVSTISLSSLPPAPKSQMNLESQRFLAALTTPGGAWRLKE